MAFYRIPTKRIAYTFGSDEINQTVTTFNPTTQAVLTTEVHTFGHDGHGSVRVLFDAASKLAQAYTYAAYGELLAIHNGLGASLGNAASSALTSMLYNGESFDGRIGQLYLRARWYDGHRFTTIDPYAGEASNPFSFNKYGFVHADPIQGVDPTGEMLSSFMSAMVSAWNYSNDTAVKYQVYSAAFFAGRPILSKVATYGLAGMTLYGAYLDPAGTMAMGPAAVADDVYSVAAAMRQFPNQAFAIIGKLDDFHRASGLIARLLPSSVDAARGTKAVVDPKGWDWLVSVTTELQRARGHLLPRWFGGGANNLAWKKNVMPLYTTANQKMLEFETQVADTLRTPGVIEVWYRVKPRYTGENPIPTEIEMEAWSIDADGMSEVFNMVIPNVL